MRVVIDPIDGSLNAKRGLPHHCLSIAVAEGATMADVVFGYVHDFGPDEEWVASRGDGARRDGRAARPVAARAPRARRQARGARASSRPTRAGSPTPPTPSRDSAHRLRAIGAIAVSLCQVAAARFDGMATLKRCRAVDAAAGQLIVREAGGLVAFTSCEDPLAAPLDLVPRSPVVAARTRARAQRAARRSPRAVIEPRPIGHLVSRDGCAVGVA